MAKTGVKSSVRVKEMALKAENVGFISVIADSGYRSGYYIVYECECNLCGSMLLMTERQIKANLDCGCYSKKGKHIFKLKVEEE